MSIPPGIPLPEVGPNPGLATLLGFIPGVGAMYNGQFVKALVHVLVFVVLIGIAGDHPIFGLFIAAWVLYQVFDANQTAMARRDGLPLPDPFGLNELGHRLGIQNPPTVPPERHGRLRAMLLRRQIPQQPPSWASRIRRPRILQQPPSLASRIRRRPAQFHTHLR